jgi:hypothetical protein
MDFYHVVATFATVAVFTVWGALELRWSSVSPSIRRPFDTDASSSAEFPSVRSLLVLTGIVVAGYLASVVVSLLCTERDRTADRPNWSR